MIFFQRHAWRWIIRPQNLIILGVFLALLALTAIYRFYQPVTHPALLQFDIFDWARQSREILQTHHLVTPTNLWVFPVWNTIVAAATKLDLFQIYLYSGAVFTTLNTFILYAIGRQLWSSRLSSLVLVFLYAVNTQLLARSINWLPETMTYTFGLALIYFYLRLLINNSWKLSIPAITILTYLYYHLHQSGLNFLVFTAITIVLYLVFILPRPKKIRLLAVAGLLVIGSIIIFTVKPISQQFSFFLKGSKNADIAFQGTAIPFEQILVDYPQIIVWLLGLGATGIIVGLFGRQRAGLKLGLLLILMITGFYFAFLYVLPNLKLYSLVPWRFYTWFSLYALIIAAHGAHILFSRLALRRRLVSVTIASIVILLIHTVSLSDNMFTADAATLRSLERVPLPAGSISFTTNANYLQTLYAVVGKRVLLYQAGADVFYSNSSSEAWQQLKSKYPVDDKSYVIISKYQLRQRPYSIAYWRNSAYYDMNLGVFQDVKYFRKYYEDTNVLVYSIVPQVAASAR